MKKLYALFMLLTAFAHAQNSGITITQDGNTCSPGSCVSLTASYPQTHETTSYGVAAIPYQNLFAYTGGTVLNNTDDDVWAQFTLPFNFCFYGQSYSSLLVGSNGVITFDNTFQPNVAGNCPWEFNSTIPSPTFPVRNAIYGVYQDTDISAAAVTAPATQNVNFYIGGTAPNRFFVVNFNELPQYVCGNTAGLQSSQVILYEKTNIIDIYIKKRTACTGWQSGRGVVGVQNAGGTLATVPANRNTGSWSTTNEAWRFSPSGNVTSSISWTYNDVPLASTDTVNICPDEGGIATATVTYPASCGNVESSMTVNYNLVIGGGLGTATPQDLYTCTDADTATFNLTVNNVIVPSPANEYEIVYYSNLTDAQNYDNNYFNNPQTYTGYDGQVIYARISALSTECFDIRQFALHITHPSGAPAGATVQYFTAGQTLADLAITGQNIQWFATATGGEALPSNTVLISGTTYYAEQANAFACELPRSSQSTRFGVTAYDALGTQAFTDVKVSITPNPVKDFLTIESTQAISAVSIYNIQGQLVSTSKENKLQSVVNCSGLANGIYLLRVETQQGIKDLKIIKQ